MSLIFAFHCFCIHCVDFLISQSFWSSWNLLIIGANFEKREQCLHLKPTCWRLEPRASFWIYTVVHNSEIWNAKKKIQTQRALLRWIHFVTCVGVVVGIPAVVFIWKIVALTVFLMYKTRNLYLRQNYFHSLHSTVLSFSINTAGGQCQYCICKGNKMWRFFL